MLHPLLSSPSFERVKALLVRAEPWFVRARPWLVPGGAVLVALIWTLAIKTGWTNSEWDADWARPSETRGKNVALWNRSVESNIETKAERDKRLTSNELKDKLGDVKKKFLGDTTKTRGDAIKQDKPEVPRELEFNPREACIQMKLQFPDRYTDMDCMSERYDSTDPWWDQ